MTSPGRRTSLRPGAMLACCGPHQAALRRRRSHSRMVILARARAFGLMHDTNDLQHPPCARGAAPLERLPLRQANQSSAQWRQHRNTIRACILLSWINQHPAADLLGDPVAEVEDRMHGHHILRKAGRADHPGPSEFRREELRRWWRPADPHAGRGNPPKPFMIKCGNSRDNERRRHLILLKRISSARRTGCLGAFCGQPRTGRGR